MLLLPLGSLPCFLKQVALSLEQFSAGIVGNRQVKETQKLHWHFRSALSFRVVEILPPITSAPVTEDTSAALSGQEPLDTRSFFVNVFFIGLLFRKNKSTFSSVKVQTPPFHLSLSFLELPVPCGAQSRSVPLRSAEKGFHVTEWKTSNYKSDLKIAQSTY